MKELNTFEKNLKVYNHLRWLIYPALSAGRNVYFLVKENIVTCRKSKYIEVLSSNPLYSIPQKKYYVKIQMFVVTGIVRVILGDKVVFLVMDFDFN